MVVVAMVAIVVVVLVVAAVVQSRELASKRRKKPEVRNLGGYGPKRAQSYELSIQKALPPPSNH